MLRLSHTHKVPRDWLRDGTPIHIINLHCKRSSTDIGAPNRLPGTRGGREERRSRNPVPDPPECTRHSQDMSIPHSLSPHRHQQQQGRPDRRPQFASQKMNQDVHDDRKRRVTPHEDTSPVMKKAAVRHGPPAGRMRVTAKNISTCRHKH
eukprot:9493066-Pyramimonas_sp.AAC.1